MVELVSSSSRSLFTASYDDQGVYFYQAYNNTIADYALKHQTLGGEDFNPVRMTWIKPNLAWALHRSDYAGKDHQNRLLQIKLPHDALADILSQCDCKKGGGGQKGRVQWDPGYDLRSTPDGHPHHFEPHKMNTKRNIQIGLKGSLSKSYRESIISIEDITELAQTIQKAHLKMLLENKKGKGRLKSIDIAKLPNLNDLKIPEETIYIPKCETSVLQRLGLVPGETADRVAQIGRGKVGLT